MRTYGYGRRRGEKVIHGRQWMTFSFGANRTQVAVVPGAYIIGQADFEAAQVPEGRHLTVLRTRGEMLFTLGTETRTVDGWFLGSLMNTASDQTLTAADMPAVFQLEPTFLVTPITLSNLAAGGSAADGPGSFSRKVIDSKAMRRGSENGKLVFWTWLGCNSSTANVYFTGSLHVLLGLRD